MARDLDRPVWRGQQPWFEIWFAVILDENRRRALWVRQTLFVPKRGDARATIWGAWFDADATPQSRAAKRRTAIDKMNVAVPNALIQIDDSTFARTGAQGSVEGLNWNASWTGGAEPSGRDLPAWLPAPTHAHVIAHDAEATATVTVHGTAPPSGGAAGAGQALAVETAVQTLRGRAFAMHLWGKRRVPTLHWIWAPWFGDGSLEVTAVSLRDRFAMGLSSLKLSGPRKLDGSPGTAAHPHGLVTATVAGARKLIHARAWAEPAQMVGYAYRDTDDRDLMIAQSDIGSAHLEVFTRSAPGLPWKPVDERRATGGVAVEIHQRTPLPGVQYLAWDALARQRGGTEQPGPRRADEVDWPDVTAIVALGLTYNDHAREAGQTIDTKAPPIAFAKHAQTFVRGDGSVRVPDSRDVLAALDATEPGLAALITARLGAVAPAVMDYEGELALVALGDIDEAALAAGTPQPFGLAAANDLSARLVQVLGEGMDRQYAYWAAAKSFPQFLPVAERVWAPAGGIAKIPELVIETKVNGDRRQKASTKELAYDLVAIVRAAKSVLGRPLARGDVISTGTPAGVGLRMSSIQRALASIVKDRLRKAEFLVSSYATSNALLRPGDVIEVDVGLAGHVRTRLIV